MKLSEKTLQDLKNRKIQFEDLNDEYFFDSEDSLEKENVLKLLDNNICSFKQLVDKIKSIQNKNNSPYIHCLFSTKLIYEKLTEANRLSEEDLKYLLDKIEWWYELVQLCRSEILIKKMFDESLFTKELVDRFNSILRASNRSDVYPTVFDLLENKTLNKEILKLSKVIRNSYLLNSFDLTKNEKLKLTEILKENEITQNRLKEIVDNHLEDDYDFNSLAQYLKKKEKKSLMNI